MKAWKAQSNKQVSSATLVMQKVNKINEEHYTEYTPTLRWCNLSSSNTTLMDLILRQLKPYDTLSQPALIKYMLHSF